MYDNVAHHYACQVDQFVMGSHRWTCSSFDRIGNQSQQTDLTCTQPPWTDETANAIIPIAQPFDIWQNRANILNRNESSQTQKKKIHNP